jgi:hypothetical protein
MRAGNRTDFTEGPSPPVRKLLIHARRTAMGGDLPGAFQLLDEAQEQGSATDRATLGMVKTELLYLEGETEKATATFDQFVAPHLNALSDRRRYAYEMNRATIKLDVFKPKEVMDLYCLQDEVAVAGVELRDARPIADAWLDVEEKRYRDATEKVWGVLLDAYRLGNLIVFESAMRRFGRLGLEINELPQAWFGAIVGHDEKLTARIAEAVIQRRDEKLVRDLLQRVLRTANLRRHFAVGCQLLDGVSDVIPDDAIESLARWLLPRASGTERRYHGSSGAVYHAWRVLGAIAHRLPAQLARQVAEAIVNHPLWQGELPTSGIYWPVRQQMVKVANGLVGVLPSESLAWLARESLPLALDRKWDTDYGDVVNLLCHVAVRAGEDIKQELGKRLYEGPRDYLLGQVAAVFGQTFLPQDRLDALARRVCENHLLCVQRVPPGQEPKHLQGRLMERTIPQPDNSTVVLTAMGMLDWATLVRLRRELSPAARDLMAKTALELIWNKDNLLINRESLLTELMEMADILRNSTIEEAMSAIEPLARGEVTYSALVGVETEKHRPLAKMDLPIGAPEKVQAAALVAMARLGRRRPQRYRRRVESVLEAAIIHPDVTVRRGAYAAFRDFPGLRGSVLLAVLMGTRDADPEGAITAFAALAEKARLRLTPFHWQLLLYSLQVAAQSTHVRLRRHAAGMLARRIDEIPAGPVRDQAEVILRGFREGLCFSVREEAAVRKG